MNIEDKLDKYLSEGFMAKAVKAILPKSVINSLEDQLLKTWDLTIAKLTLGRSDEEVLDFFSENGLGTFKSLSSIPKEDKFKIMNKLLGSNR